MSPNLSNSQTIKIGSRASRLARLQVDEVLSLLKTQGVHFSVEHKAYQTQGDRDKTTPLSSNPADDFFTDTLDVALLKGEIDFAVHSAKDLPQNLKPGLSIFALTRALDETDAFVGPEKLSQLKRGGRVGASSSLRQEAVKAISPDVRLVDVRGTIEERLALVDHGAIDGLIAATCALKRLKLDHRIKEIMPWEASPLQGQLAVVGRTSDAALREKISVIDIRKSYGKVLLVGAGPGDPELITLKGINALKWADCVFYDFLIDQKLLQYAPKAQKIYVGKRKGEHTLPQRELSRMLKEKAVAGKNVVRLKGGDPLVFGRGAEEIEYLRSFFIEVEVFPGVSSATGIPSQLGIPLTARGVASSVAFVSGHEEKEDRKYPKPVQIPSADTIVFLMGLTKLGIIVKSLLAQGWKPETPIAIISKGTTPEEKIVCGSLLNIEKIVLESRLEPPALIIVGETVKLMRPGRNFLTAAASDHHILYLGTHPERYRSLGQIIHFPLIEISDVRMNKKTEQKILKDLEHCELILLTSPHGVRHFFDFLKKNKVSLSQLKVVDFAVVGQETAAVLEDYDITPQLKASTETSEGLLKELVKKYRLKGKKVLFPRSSLPNPFLKKELTRRGAKVTEVTIYQNTKPREKKLPREGIDSVFFTSPSTVQNFLKDYKSIPRNWQILSKGPTTSEALRKAGYKNATVVYGN